MSVTASVFCQRCREFAPRIGDGGAVGFPSLKDTPDTVTDEYQTFGYLKKGFDAIGYKPWELEAIAAFLKAHQRHNVSLYLEGQDVRYDSDDRDDEDEDQPGALDDVSDATEFVFDDAGFVEGLFEAACDKCGVSVRSGTERLRPFKPFTLKPAAIRTFMTRVRNADASNFHRVFSLLDYDGEQERLAAFLTEHASHRPRIRIVRADASHAEPGRGLPWKLSWHKPGPFRDDREPLIAADLVFAIIEPWLTGDHESPPVLHCYSLDGDELWQRDLRGGVAPGPELTSVGLVLPVYSTKSQKHEMLCLDPDGGEIVSARPTRYSLRAWFPDRRSFVASRYVSETEESRTYVGVVEWPSLELRWESPPFEGAGHLRSTAHVTPDTILLVGDSRTGRSSWVSCLDAATGRERWKTSLAEFGETRVSDNLIWRDWFLVRVEVTLVALDLTDGRIAWQMEAGFWHWHESHDLLRGSNISHVFAVDLNERAVRFATARKQLTGARQMIDSSHSVVAGDEILIVDQSSRTLWGLDGKTGRPIWKHRPASGVTGQYPALSGDHLVFQGRTGLCSYTRSRT